MENWGKGRPCSIVADTVAQLYSTIAWKSEICKQETWTFTVAEEIPKQNIDGMACLQKKKIMQLTVIN